MARFVIGLLIGLVVGGVLAYFLFVGAPRAVNIPGTPIQPPDPNGPPAGAAQVVLRQEFFNQVLGTIFQTMSPPSFPLSSGGNQGCEGRITVLPQGSGVQTSVRFENNTLAAPLAFTGSYNSPVGCLQFSGWGQARMDLRFDQSSQSVFGQLNLETVNLDGVNPVFSGLITPIVQSTLNNQVNPIQIIDGRQLTVNVPIAAANGTLQAAVNDVRAEVRDNALNLYVIYAFNGGGVQQPAAPAP